MWRKVFANRLEFKIFQCYHRPWWAKAHVGSFSKSFVPAPMSIVRTINIWFIATMAPAGCQWLSFTIGSIIVLADSKSLSWKAEKKIYAIRRRLWLTFSFILLRSEESMTQSHQKWLRSQLINKLYSASVKKIIQAAWPNPKSSSWCCAENNKQWFSCWDSRNELQNCFKISIIVQISQNDETK